MSLTLKTEDVPASTQTTRIITCDCCGRANEPGGDDEWGDGWYHRTEVTVHIKKIVSYPEAGSSEGMFWDFCPKCFEKKVQPLLETIAKPRTESEDW